MEKLRGEAQRGLNYIIVFIKWLLIAGITGAIGGALGSAFHFSVEWANGLRWAHHWILYTLPLGGALIALVYKKCGMESYGTNQVLESVDVAKPIPLKLVPLIFGGTVLTHLCGGSSGREGAALQLGGTLGNNIGKLFHLDAGDERLITMCGMGAVFSALFGTPLAAAFFAMEVTSVGKWYYAGMIPCLTASLAAYGISLLFGIAPTAFVIDVLPALSILNLGRIVLLAALCAWVSVLFVVALHQTAKQAARWIKPGWLRGAAGGAVLVLLTVLVGNMDYNGAGMNQVGLAMAGTARPEAFLLKILFTAVTIGCGFKGGEVVPSFFIGATFGCAVAPLLGLPAGFAAGIGLVAVFCGVVNCPIASILLSYELFGGVGLVYFAVACAVSYMMSGYFSLYGTQHILYSKTRAENNDMQTH